MTCRRWPTGRSRPAQAPALAALNETLRDDYVADCRKGVDRWNRTLAEVGLELRLPHVGFNRAVGGFRDHHVSPDGRLVDDADVGGVGRRVAADRRRPGPRRVADARRHRAREDGRLAGRAGDRASTPSRSTTSTSGSELTTSVRGDDDDEVQRSGLAARPPRRRPGDGGRTAFRRRRRGDGLRRAAARGVPRPARARARSTCAAASASPSCSTTSWRSRRGSSAPCGPASCRCRCRRCSTASDLAAIVADAGAGVGRAVAGLRRLRRRPRRAPTPSCATPSSSVTPPADAAVPVHAWASFADDDEAPVAATDADSPAFWLYSSGTTGVPKGVMHRHGSPQATAETYAREVLDIGPDDRCLSVAKLFFAFGLGNSLTFPLAAGGQRDPQPAAADAARRRRAGRAPSSRRCSSPAPASSPACSTPTSPASTFASVRATVTAGEALPADLQRRFAARFGHPVLDGIGTTEALHIFLSNRTGEERPGTSGTAGARLRRPARRRHRRVRHGRRHARLPAGEGARRWPPGTGAATPRRVPRSRASGWRPATCTPAPRTATGRSSGATAT